MRTNGFTLIELLVTLTVITVLSLLSIASLSNFIKKNEQQVILDEIRTVVQYAKIQAVNIGNQVSLSPLDTTSDWSKGVVLTQFNKKTNKNETLYQWQWHHPHWILEWSGINSSNKIVLSNNPINAISNGHFTLTRDQSKERVELVLNRLGRVRVKD